MQAQLQEEFRGLFSNQRGVLLGYGKVFFTGGWESSRICTVVRSSGIRRCIPSGGIDNTRVLLMAQP